MKLVAEKCSEDRRNLRGCNDDRRQILERVPVVEYQWEAAARGLGTLNDLLSQDAQLLETIVLSQDAQLEAIVNKNRSGRDDYHPPLLHTQHYPRHQLSLTELQIPLDRQGHAQVRLNRAGQWNITAILHGHHERQEAHRHASHWIKANSNFQEQLPLLELIAGVIVISTMLMIDNLDESLRTKTNLQDDVSVN